MKYPAGFALALISVVGCSSSPAPAPQAPSTPAPETLSEVEVIDVEAFGKAVHAEVPRVVLLDAGDGEHAPLRWRFEPWTYELDVRLLHGTTATGPNVMIDEGHVVEARVSIELQPDDTGRTAMVGIEVLEAELAGMSGSHEHPYADVAATKGEIYALHVTSRGQQIGHGVVGDGKNSPAMVALTDEIASTLLVPLPEEPVAVGARWRTRAPVVTSNVVMIEETVYTLKSREEAVTLVSASVHQLPLADAQGIIPADQLDSQRTRDAIAALGTQAMSELDRKADPSARGEWYALFAPTALFGMFSRTVTLTARGQVKAESGTYDLDVEIVHNVDLLSPALRDEVIDAAPADTSAAR